MGKLRGSLTKKWSKSKKKIAEKTINRMMKVREMDNMTIRKRIENKISKIYGNKFYYKIFVF